MSAELGRMAGLGHVQMVRRCRVCSIATDVLCERCGQRHGRINRRGEKDGRCAWCQAKGYEDPQTRYKDRVWMVPEAAARVRMTLEAGEFSVQ